MRQAVAGNQIRAALVRRVRVLRDGGDTITAIAARAGVSRGKLSRFLSAKGDLTTRAAARVAAAVGMEMREQETK